MSRDGDDSAQKRRARMARVKPNQAGGVNWWDALLHKLPYALEAPHGCLQSTCWLFISSTGMLQNIREEI